MHVMSYDPHSTHTHITHPPTLSTIGGGGYMHVMSYDPHSTHKHIPHPQTLSTTHIQTSTYAPNHPPTHPPAYNHTHHAPTRPRNPPPTHTWRWRSHRPCRKSLSHEPLTSPPLLGFFSASSRTAPPPSSIPFFTLTFNIAQHCPLCRTMVEMSIMVYD